MSNDFDVNELAATVVQQNIERLWHSIYTGAKKANNSVRIHLETTYKDYVNRLIERYGRGKSFFIRSEPTPLYSFFVPLDLRASQRTLVRPEATDLGKAAPFSIIIGSGGTGKSMMMRHILLSALQGNAKTPVFLELRQLNQSDETLVAALTRTLKQSGLNVDDDFIEKALEAGQFLILLDGFDEVVQTARKRITSEIQTLARVYPKNWIAMSSRPDQTLDGWDTFTQLRVVPLDLDRAVELVTKLPFDDTTKSRFVNDIRTHLFEKHESFLSNPLLLSIMLLTYSDVAHIPHKLSTFYSQAFESLFHRHDALKSGFQRERQSGLDVHDFGRAFAAFSLLSYDTREFSFTSSRAIELAERARDISMLTYAPKAFVDDAAQAVCLLIEDGMDLAFAHRSFQEYFSARFIQQSPPELKAKLVNRYSSSVESDAVMGLLYEIDPYIVERHYLLPQLAEIREKTGVIKTVGARNHIKYIRLIYSSFQLRDDDERTVFAGIRDSSLYNVGAFAYSRYHDWSDLTYQNQECDSESILATAFANEFGDGEITTKQLKTSSSFFAAIAEFGVRWSRRYLQSLMDIETEIRKRHSENKESLDQLLATSRSLRRR